MRGRTVLPLSKHSSDTDGRAHFWATCGRQGTPGVHPQASYVDVCDPKTSSICRQSENNGVRSSVISFACKLTLHGRMIFFCGSFLTSPPQDRISETVTRTSGSRTFVTVFNLRALVGGGRVLFLEIVPRSVVDFKKRGSRKGSRFVWRREN